MKKSPKSLKQETYCLSSASGGHPCSEALQPASSAAPPALLPRPAALGVGAAATRALLCQQSPVLFSLRTRPGLRRRSSASYCRPNLRHFEEEPSLGRGEACETETLLVLQDENQNEKDTGSMPWTKLSTTRDVASVPASGSTWSQAAVASRVPNKSGQRKPC